MQTKNEREIAMSDKKFADFQRFLWKKTAKNPTFFEIF